MKYIGMPKGMWLLFHRSFRKETVNALGFSECSAAETEKNALRKYKEIIAGLPEFEKGDRFKMNIVNCAMLAAFYLNMEEKPDVEQMTKYYEKVMMTGPMRAFCRMAGKKIINYLFHRSPAQSCKYASADPQGRLCHN